MGQVINFARYRRVVSFEGYKRRRLEITQESNYEEEPAPITVSRFSARRDLYRRLDAAEVKLSKANSQSADLDTCRDELKALKPRIEEFDTYCPPTSAPFSPQASESKAFLSPEQFKHMHVLNQHIEAISARLTDLVPEAE